MSISSISAGMASSLFGTFAGTGGAKAGGQANSAVQDFLDYTKKSPAEQMRASVLKSMGLSDDDLKAMSADQRKAAEESIAQKIKDQVMMDSEKKTGLITDLKA